MARAVDASKAGEARARPIRQARAVAVALVWTRPEGAVVAMPARIAETEPANAAAVAGARVEARALVLDFARHTGVARMADALPDR